VAKSPSTSTTKSCRWRSSAVAWRLWTDTKG
jgi:hypothetical protein